MLLAFTATAQQGTMLDRHLAAFLYITSCPTNICNTNTQPLGTCFFVVVPVTPSAETGFSYLVTARHVLFGTNGVLVTNACFRYRTRMGSIAYTKTLSGALVDPSDIFRVYPKPGLNRPPAGEEDLDFVSSGWPRVFTHPDKSVDLAIIEGWNPKELAAASFPYDHVLGRDWLKVLKVTEGDEMFFVGMFTPFFGSTDNYPIYRFGHLSMLAGEKIPWGDEAPQELFLMDALTFPGNSGAPAFFQFNTERNPNGARYYLAGVVKGYWSYPQPIGIAEAKAIPVSLENMGVTAVIPSYFIRDVLDSAVLKQDRDELAKALSAFKNTKEPKTEGTNRPSRGEPPSR